jgi:hypothetical protein
MGLTIHYRITAPAGLSARQAAALVRHFHADAQFLVDEGRIARVLPISSASEDLKRHACAWRSLPHPHFPDTTIGQAIIPEAGWIFPVEIGADCELLWIGLCRYPSHVEVQGRRRATGLGSRWRFFGFCKTQYASLHGWEHFERCHLAALALLTQCARTAGVHVRINDEGGYWPGRDLKALRANLENMNGLVAALAGAAKDAADDTDEGPAESPIFAHPQFERLEAKGLSANADAIAQTLAAVRKL